MKGIHMLNNTKYKLTHDKKLNIAFFGGSLTEGAGASDKKKTSYAALTAKWFCDNFPDAQISNINASIGGTGTGLGMFRCNYDVLRHSPDLIFIEYATNDSGYDYDKMLIQTESIFRIIRKNNPYADIINLVMTEDYIIDNIEKGLEFEARSVENLIARHYSSPSWDIGEAFHAFILKNGGNCRDFMPDGAHPNDNGYKFCADALTALLGETLSKCDGTTLIKHSMPSPYCKITYDNADITICDKLSNLSLDGFELKQNENGRFPVYLESLRQGDCFSFEFEGTCGAFYWMGGGISHDVLVSIDGGREFVCHSWDHCFRSFQKLECAYFAKDIAYGKHSVKVRVADCDSNENVFVRIEAIMTA